MPHTRIVSIPFKWLTPPLSVVLVEPEIPPNTGNIARLCAATGSILNIVGEPNFHLTDSRLKRAGLDYWESVKLVKHKNFESFLNSSNHNNFYLFSTAGKRCYLEVNYKAGDALVFGNESKGLPDQFLINYPERVCVIPLKAEKVRSLNLATAVSIVLYEALRQNQ
jgi:tRNA (cytidine/uridine-2'-O-)-methyltransferase